MNHDTTYNPARDHRCPSCGQAVPHQHNAEKRGTVADMGRALSALALPLDDLWASRRA